jgi:hypothetical protein
MPTYDLFVYREMDDPTHDSPPAVGQNANEWFGEGFENLYVSAIAPGMHPNRITVVLGQKHGPDTQQEMKAYFTAR